MMLIVTSKIDLFSLSPSICDSAPESGLKYHFDAATQYWNVIEEDGFSSGIGRNAAGWLQEGFRRCFQQDSRWLYWDHL
jgi:hypothetical protein